MLSAGLRLSVRVDAVGSGARPELSARWCVLAPAQRGMLLVLKPYPYPYPCP